VTEQQAYSRTRAETEGIRLHDVGIRLGRRRRLQVLEDVSLDVKRGEFCCLIGPSGCGKSTLLNILAGFVEPSQGEVSLSGRSTDDRSLKRAVVFQEYALFPWLTAVRNVEFGMAGRGERHARRAKAKEYLAHVGLEEFGDVYPHELSGGMQQRVAIARALACEPDFLLMDEPLGALDALTRDQLQELVVELWERFNQTVVYVTHNVSEAVFLGDRVAVFTPRPGRLRSVVDIDLPRPRRRADPEFVRLVEQITAEVRRRD
jgi:NitT/TauT family transport system ATP-binding protein